MEIKLKKGHTYLDWPNKRITIHYKYNGEVIIKLIFNFREDVEDELDGNFRVFMHMMTEEEAEYLKERKAAAWKRLCQVKTN